MWVRLLDASRARKPQNNASATTRRACRRSLIGESLEHRQLLAASLAPIANLNVPALQGYTQLLDGSATTDAQTFSAGSSNPDVAVSIVSTAFWNVGVSYTDPNNAANDFSGTLTFALFGSLTPNTVRMITEFTDDSYYVNSGQFIWRVVSDFAGTTATVIQGGATSGQTQGNGLSSGQPNTPFANENLQQLAPTGVDQLFMANAGGTETNDTQFFIATGPLNQELGYGYTDFGQLVSGAGILAEIASVPVGPNYFNENSLPVNQITITSTSLSTTNSNGVVLIDTTQAHPGETATITVTAQDGSTQTQQSFQVTVGPYSGDTVATSLATVNFKPYASPATATTGSYSSVSIQLAGQATFPAAPAPAPTYAILSTPAHGTVSNFNPATGTVTYTPTPGFVGTDSFTYVAYTNAPNTSAATASSNPATVTITVNQGVVTLREVDIVTSGKNKVTKLELIWSGALKPSLAKSKAPYRLRIANRFGSYTGRGSHTIAITKVRYDQSAWNVTLTPGTMFPKNEQVELLVHGNGKKGLKDIFGQFIAGSGGQSGTDSISIV